MAACVVSSSSSSSNEPKIDSIVENGNEEFLIQIPSNNATAKIITVESIANELFCNGFGTLSDDDTHQIPETGTRERNHQTVLVNNVETVTKGSVPNQTSSVEHAEIVIVRHGETTWNASGRIQGELESELNEVGLKQAVAIAERLGKEPKPVAVYSSNLKRAYDTANMIAQKCLCSEVIVVPDLKERHVGSLQGLYWSEIQEKVPEAHQAFFSSEKDLEIPGGGESFNQLCERSIAAFKEIASKHKGERVIVVTHGGILRAIYMSVTGEPSAGKILNASVNVFHISSDNKWEFKTWNDVSHLDEVVREIEIDTTLDDKQSVTYLTAAFEVFKLTIVVQDHSTEELPEKRCGRLPEDSYEWVRMTNLCGDTMFLGQNASMSIPASDVYPGCKSNNIYYTDSIGLFD